MAIRVMHFGLGPIGAAVARQVATRRGFKVVGAAAPLGNSLPGTPMET